MRGHGGFTIPPAGLGGVQRAGVLVARDATMAHWNNDDCITCHIDVTYRYLMKASPPFY